jgi:NAD+ synthase (glutamine-hydrolysing)
MNAHNGAMSDPLFFDPASHGFVRLAVAVPTVAVADPARNAAETLSLLAQAAERGALVALFPELGLTAYTCDDLFHQQALQSAALDALAAVRDATRDVATVAVVGLPVAVDGAL